jgi:hypothetical protein
MKGEAETEEQSADGDQAHLIPPQSGQNHSGTHDVGMGRHPKGPNHRTHEELPRRREMAPQCFGPIL